MRNFIIQWVMAGVVLGMLMVILVFMTGCHTVKHEYKVASVHATAQMDSLEQAAAKLYEQDSSGTTEYRESTAGVPKASVSVEATSASPGVYTSDTGRARIVLIVQPNGAVTAKCTCDSVERKVTYWTAYAGYYKRVADSQAFAISQTKVSSSAIQSVLETKKTSGIAWWWIPLMFLCGMVVAKYVLPWIIRLVKWYAVPIIL